MRSIVMMFAAAVLFAPAQGTGSQTPATGTATTNPRVALETNKGTIVLELDAAKAPITVKNFVDYVKAGQYDGTIFHRVIAGFMVQGGGFSFAMEQKAVGAPIKNESSNGVKNKRGTVAMARTANPDSATAQFFVNLVDNDFLDYPKAQGSGYAVFAKVVEGMDVVDAIAKVKTGVKEGFRDVPNEPILIQKAVVQ